MNADRRDHRDPPEEGQHISLLLNISERLAVIETQTGTMIGEQDEAKVSRRLMHAKQDSMGLDLAAVQADIRSISPKVLEHEALRQQFRGASYVLVGLGSVAMIAAGFVLKEAWSWFAGHLRWK